MLLWRASQRSWCCYHLILVRLQHRSLVPLPPLIVSLKRDGSLDKGKLTKGIGVCRSLLRGAEGLLRVGHSRGRKKMSVYMGKSVFPRLSVDLLYLVPWFLVLGLTEILAPLASLSKVRNPDNLSVGVFVWFVGSFGGFSR